MYGAIIWVYTILFLVSTVTGIANTNDPLRCNKLYNDNYYFGQTCVLIEKSIYEDVDLATISNDPSFRKDQVKTVIFERSKVIYIPPQLFTYFVNIERVYLNGTSLENITKNSFQDAHKTREIYLNQNNLRTIGQSVFSKATQCNKLDLTNNLIETLDDEAFSGLSQLKQLYLGFNRLTTISDHLLSPLISINILDLSNNNIDLLGDRVFAYNRQIQNISLEYNSIRNLNMDLRDNIVLQIFDVSSNVIENATLQRKENSNLLTVYASHNQWKCDVLNSTIVELEKLQIMLKPKPNLSFNDNTNIHGIECEEIKEKSFFDFDTTGFNWPIITFVIGCSIIFIVGALVVLTCRRKRQGHWSTPV